MKAPILGLRCIKGLAFIGAWVYAQRQCPVDKTFLRIPSSFSGLVFRSYPEDHSEDTLWVPVVVHVIESYANEIPSERVGAQLRALNRDFAPARIQFYLPRYGPSGEPTCGLTRTVSPLSSHDWSTEEDTLKNLIYWAPDSFLNIWVVRSMPMQVIGYARALNDPQAKAGIVLVAGVLGEGEGVRPPYDRGRTAVHEMGHVFSLYHPFEGGCRGMTPQTCAIEGDEICDTPPQRQATYGCPRTPPNTCQETPIDLPDPIHNFMGYVDDSCMTHFTPEQIARMRAFLRFHGSTLISQANQLARGRTTPFDHVCTELMGISTPFIAPPKLKRKGNTLFVEGAEELKVYDVAGRLLHQTRGDEICIDALPFGLYYLQVFKTGYPFTYTIAPF
ncbi:MAG: zinc metalloprotease [Bacteroidia bacterium]|nr:zinc metalloprotease [Bacteroidia bacterium]